MSDVPNIPANAIILGQGVWLSSNSRTIVTEHVRSCMCLVAKNGTACALAHIPDRFTTSFEYRVSALADAVPTIDKDALVESDHSLTSLVDAMLLKVPGAEFVLLGGVQKNQFTEDAAFKLYVALWVDMVDRLGVTSDVSSLIERYGTLQLPVQCLSKNPNVMKYKDAFSSNPVPFMTKMKCFEMCNINRVVNAILCSTINTGMLTCIMQGGLMNTATPDFAGMQKLFQESVLFMQRFVPFLKSYGIESSRVCADEIVKAVANKGLKMTDNSCTYICGMITRSDGLSVSVTPSGEITTWSDLNKLPTNKFYTAEIPPHLLGFCKGFMYTLSESGDKLIGTWEN